MYWLVDIEDKFSVAPEGGTVGAMDSQLDGLVKSANTAYAHSTSVAARARNMLSSEGSLQDKIQACIKAKCPGETRCTRHPVKSKRERTASIAATYAVSGFGNPPTCLPIPKFLHLHGQFGAESRSLSSLFGLKTSPPRRPSPPLAAQNAGPVRDTPGLLPVQTHGRRQGGERGRLGGVRVPGEGEQIVSNAFCASVIIWLIWNCLLDLRAVKNWDIKAEAQVAPSVHVHRDRGRRHHIHQGGQARQGSEAVPVR